MPLERCQIQISFTIGCWTTVSWAVKILKKFNQSFRAEKHVINRIYWSFHMRQLNLHHWKIESPLYVVQKVSVVEHVSLPTWRIGTMWIHTLPCDWMWLEGIGCCGPSWHTLLSLVQSQSNFCRVIFMTFGRVTYRFVFVFQDAICEVCCMCRETSRSCYFASRLKFLKHNTVPWISRNSLKLPKS